MQDETTLTPKSAAAADDVAAADVAAAANVMAAGAIAVAAGAIPHTGTNGHTPGTNGSAAGAGAAAGAASRRSGVTEANRCTARSKSGGRCGNPAAPGYTVCYYHGGKTPRGPASPNWRHGRYSRYVPVPALLERYQAGLADPELISLRDELALIDARSADLLGALTSGDSRKRWEGIEQARREYEAAGPGTAARQGALERMLTAIDGGIADRWRWEELYQSVELRRKLADTERKRLVDLQQMITTEGALALVGALVNSVRTHVGDQGILNAISEDVIRIIGSDAGAGIIRQRGAEDPGDR